MNIEKIEKIIDNVELFLTLLLAILYMALSIGCVLENKPIFSLAYFVLMVCWTVIFDIKFLIFKDRYCK